MAAPSSPSHCDSAIKSSSSKLSHFCYIYSNTPRRFIVCTSHKPSSSPPSSSVSRCSFTSTTTDTTLHGKKITAKISSERKNVVPIQNKIELNNAESLPVKSVEVSKNRRRRFNDVLERKALWRRIFFASKKVRSIILLNVITIIYGSNIPVVKEVEAFVDPELFTVVRFVFSAIPLIPFVLQAKDNVQTRNAGVELGFWLGSGYLMQALGLLTSDAGRASFISLFTVIVVPLLDGMLGSIIPARTWYGALMSIIGVAMLESSGSPPCVGDLLNFLSAVFFGVHMLRTEHISRSTSKDNFLPLLGFQVCIVALLSTIWYMIGGSHGGMQEFNLASWTWATFWHGIVAFPWIPAIYTGIFSTVLCLWIEMAAMRDVSATETAIIYGLEPVWGAGFAWFLLGERWGINGWIGAAFVLGGSLAVQIQGVSSLTSLQQIERNIKKSDEF